MWIAMTISTQYLTRSEGFPPKPFGRSDLAYKIKHHFVNFIKDIQIMKFSLKEKHTPEEAFSSEKVASEI